MPSVNSRAWSNRQDFLTDPDLARAVLRDPAFTISQIAPYLEMLEERHGRAFPHLRKLARHSFSFQSGEDHLAARRAIAPFFSARAVAGWQAEADQAVQAAIGHLRQAREPDLMRDFAEPAFLHLMRPFIGLHGGDDAWVMGLIRTANNASQPMLSLGALARIDQAIAALRGLVDAAQEEDAASRQSFTAFTAGRCGRFEEDWGAEYVAISALIASHTAAQTLGYALYALLLQGAAAWADVASEGWAERALERVISLYPSTRTLVRMATRDATVGGCPFHQGKTTILDVVAANAALRNRSGGRRKGQVGHMSFGAGAHKCPGAALSHLFLSRALPALATAFPRLALHRDRVTFHVSPLVQYPTSLPCELDGRNTRSTARLVEVKEAEPARQIVNDDTLWSPPLMEPHLRALQEKSGKDLSQAIRIARNAMFFMSGPRHAEARRAVADCLGGNRLVRWQPLIDACVETSLGGLAAAPQPDLIRDFADPLFRRITHPILGIAPRDPDHFDTLAPVLQDVLEPWLPIREIMRLQDVFEELLDGLSVPVPGQDDPAPSLLAHLLSADMEGFDEEDRKSLVLVLYGASFNLTHTLGNTLHHLLTLAPEERAAARDPAWVAAELEALISLCASPKYIYRMARATTEVGELPVRKGDTLRLQLLSINRPLGTGNLAFGHGLHRCVGAALSKRMLKNALAALFRRFPDIALLPQRHEYSPMSQTVALASLPCALSSLKKGTRNE
jgi:cytochrome P450